MDPGRSPGDADDPTVADMLWPQHLGYCGVVGILISSCVCMYIYAHTGLTGNSARGIVFFFELMWDYINFRSLFLIDYGFVFEMVRGIDYVERASL